MNEWTGWNKTSNITFNMTFSALRLELVCPPSAVTIDDADVLWSPGSPDKATAPGRDLLDDFIRVTDHAETLERFVRRHGALGLCRSHQLPWQHSIAALGVEGTVCSIDAKQGLSCEPRTAVAAFASEARSILHLASEFGKGTDQLDDYTFINAIDPNIVFPLPGQSSPATTLPDQLFDLLAQDWPEEYRTPAPKAPTDEDHSLWLIDQVVERWLKLGDVRLRIFPSRPLPETRLFGDGVFGSLALQLVGRVSKLLRGDRSETPILETECTGCDRIYVPSRRPNPNQDRYCPDCRNKGVPQRAASRRYREKRLEKESRDG